MKIVFVGGGTMAQAIISSLISSNKKFEITVSDPILKVRNEIKKIQDRCSDIELLTLLQFSIIA